MMLFQVETKETWKPVVGYEGWYSVSSLGRIRRDMPAFRTRPGNIIRQWTNDRGYLFVVLCKENKAKTIMVHCIVANAFIGVKNKGTVINHMDGVKTNNSASNLEHCSYSENEKHAYRNGQKFGMIGSDNAATKLSLEDVLSIKREYGNGTISQDRLGKLYGVSQTQIGRIVRGERWKHLKTATN